MLCYVLPNGSYGRSTQPPHDAVAISEEIYNMLEDNPGMLDIEVTDGSVRISPSLISYKARAVEVIRNEVGKLLPSEQYLNQLHRSVACEQSCFDEVLGWLTVEDTRKTFAQLNERYNKLRFIQHDSTSRVEQATACTQVDILLEEFSHTLGAL